MTYSYTQLAQYLACPLRYRYRYLDGWQEKETRAGLLFGRAISPEWLPELLTPGPLPGKTGHGRCPFDSPSGRRSWLA